MTHRKTLLVITTLMLIVAVGALRAPAETFTKLYDFGAPGGPGSPGGILAQGRDGNIYGTTSTGGAYGSGTAFAITPSGTATFLYSFDGAHGYYPAGGLTLSTDGHFYGATTPSPHFDCKDTGCGTVFKMTPEGKFIVMYTFHGTTDVSSPQAPPIEAVDGNFYGTAQGSGPWPQYHPGGIYKLTPSGELTRLYVMGADVPLLQTTNGNFYATSSTGGSFDVGVLVEITPSGQVELFYNFNCPGCGPHGALIQGRDGNVYGTAPPLAFRLSPAGFFSVLYDFGQNPSEGWPTGGLVQATDDNFYGLTWEYPYTGAIYRVQSDGSFSWVYTFQIAAKSHPIGALFQHTNGLLYGLTAGDGTYGSGTLFSLDVGLAPFVSLVSTSGKIGKNIGILGQGFSGTTSVSFNGIPATFKVVSDTFLEALVPNGALTGAVTVTTSAGTLTSNKVFRVWPKLQSFSPTSGTVGTPVVITGTGFTQTLRVGFGGVAATSFTIDSDTQVTAIVPAGAVTGKIAVATQGGHDAGARVFTVTP